MATCAICRMVRNNDTPYELDVRSAVKQKDICYQHLVQANELLNWKGQEIDYSCIDWEVF